MATAFQPTAFQNTAFQADAVTPAKNWALAANGGVATASSSNAGPPAAAYTPARANDGFRAGKNWGKNLTDAGWNDATSAVYPDWLQIDFAAEQTIGTINVITLQDDVGNSWSGLQDPTLTTTFTKYGITAFDVQYWDGTAFVNVPGGSVTENNKVWRQFIFSPITTTKIRVLVNAAMASFSRIVELEAWSPGTGWAGISRGRSLAGISRGRMLQ